MDRRSADLAADLLDRWELRPDAAPTCGAVALVLAVIRADGVPAVLKLQPVNDDGDVVVQHVTVHGTHRGSTMPLLSGVAVSGRAVAWRFMHIWRVADGQVVEHWACRDDMGMVEKLESS